MAPRDEGIRRRRPRVWIPNNRDMRLKAMTAAELLCDTLRARLQNCVISHVYFNPDVRRGFGNRLLEAQIVLAAYTDLNEEDQQDVLVSLREQASCQQYDKE